MTDSVDARKRDMTAMFDRVAPDYDDGGAGIFSHFGRKLVDAVGIRSGQRVLDVAAGRGATAIPAAELTAPGGAVVGVDLSPAMVATARSDAERAGVMVDFRVGDAESLDVADASFDVLFCGFGLMFLPRVGLALSEFRRVVTPGGIVGVSTWKTTQVADLGLVLARNGFMDVDREVLRFADPSALSGYLTEAGFESTEVREEILVTEYRDIEEYWTVARGTGMRRWIDQLDERQVATVRAQLSERLADRTDNGRLRIDATALIAVAQR